MKTWSYIACFLDAVSKNLLKTSYTCPEGWTWYGDHVTLAFNNGNDPDDVVNKIEAACEFKTIAAIAVTGYAYTDKVKALRVEFMFPSGLAGNYHVTLAAAPGIAPKESNNIPADAWKPERKLTLWGKVGYSLNNEVFYKRPLTGEDAKIWSVMQGFDFPKTDLMSAYRQAGIPITEERYYKAEKAARKAFVDSLFKK